MRIAVVGTPQQVQELKNKVSSNHELIEVKNNQFEGFDLVFDLDFDNHTDRVSDYAGLKDIPVVVGSAKKQLEYVISTAHVPVECMLFGINNLPGFIDRSLAEMCSTQNEHRASVEKLFNALEWPIKWVESRVGLVTPRIVLMIINEAYYTVQEGTATKEDIDIGMKLGTAYPKGPFEWAKEIGIQNVYEVLEALYVDTFDQRYKVCPMLKTEYLQNAVMA